MLGSNGKQLKRCFFVSIFFQKSIQSDLGGPLLLKISILLPELPEVAIHRYSRTFEMEANKIHFLLEFEKIFMTSIFLSTSEGLFLNVPEIKVITFMNSPFLTSLVQRQKVQKQLFFKIDVPKNFTILTVKHICRNIFLIEQPTFRAATLVKGDYNTCVFL